VVTIILDDYLKTIPGVKDLPQPGIEPQPPSPQSDAITIRPWRPHVLKVCLNVKEFDNNGWRFNWQHCQQSFCHPGLKKNYSQEE